MPKSGLSAELVDAVGEYRAAVERFWSELRAQADRTRSADASEQAVHRARASLAELARDAERATQAAREARGRWTALHSSIGATVDQIRAHLVEANRLVGELESELSRLEEVRVSLRARVGNTRGRLMSPLEARLDEQGARRSTAVGALQRFASSGLLEIGVPGLELPPLPWAPDPAIRVAHGVQRTARDRRAGARVAVAAVAARSSYSGRARVAQALAATDANDHAWERVQHEATSHVMELQDALSVQGIRRRPTWSKGVWSSGFRSTVNSAVRASSPRSWQMMWSIGSAC